MEPVDWFFVDEQRQPHPIGEADLRIGLHKGTVGPTTLVWSSGWKQWLPADQVRQFHMALGNRAREAQIPLIDRGQVKPPPVPENACSGPVPTPIPASPAKKPLIRRPAIPTMVDIELPSAGDTLRPPGAVPPPPRGIPKSLLGEPDDWEPNVTDNAETKTVQGQPPPGSSHRPSRNSLRLAPTAATKQHPEPSRARELRQEASHAKLAERGEDDEADEVPPEELSAPASADTSGVPYDPDALQASLPRPNLHADAWSRLNQSWRTKRWAIVALGLAATSLVAGTLLTLQRRPRPLPPNQVSLPARAPKPQRGPLACIKIREAQRISPTVLQSVTPIVSERMMDGRLAVGFAESPLTAAGITVDPSDLDVRFPYRETQEQRVVSVAPLSSSGQLQFHAIREGSPLKQARAVNGDVAFSFGLTESGFARQTMLGTPETVWAVGDKIRVTDPRLGAIPGRAHAVTYREGGQTGSILLGWLTVTGSSMSGPFPLSSPVGLLGNPNVAAGDDAKALVVYAGRGDESESWSVYLSEAKVGEAPSPAHRLEVPSGGPGGDCIAPAAVRTADGRWLVQWSEGPQRQRQIRIVTLDDALHPIGSAITASPPDRNSGLGLLWSSGGYVLSLFVVSAGKSAELWATPIGCSE